MGELFKRNVSVTFRAFDEKNAIDTTVKDLRILFKVKKTSEKTPNPSEIKIYNLNPSNRSFFEGFKQVTDKTTDKKESIYKNIITLQVGYGEILESLFTGNISTAKTVKEGPDFVTSITAGDGEKAFTEAKFDKSYAAGTSYKTMITDIMKSMKDAGGIALGALDSIKNEVTQNGITLSGLSNILLSKLADKQDLEWNIQDNELQILEKFIATVSAKNAAVFLTPKTGLIGVPVKTDKGIEFKSLLNTRIKPGGVVEIESEALTTTVLIKEATFEGDTHGAPFFVSGVGTEI